MKIQKSNICCRLQKIYLVLLLSIFFCLSSQAQFFSAHINSGKRNKNIPTIIKSDTMDFDISKNIAIFSGNVQVNDAEMKIFCHKMIINFEVTGEKKEDKLKKGNKSVKNIICLKNVVIIRKLGKGDKGGEQKALAGKAIYDVKAGKITLTIKPELKRGPDLIKGTRIEFWLDSERLNVDGATELQLRSNPNQD